METKPPREGEEQALRIVRVQVQIASKGERVAAFAGPLGEGDAEEEVLSMPERYASNPMLREAFARMATLVAEAKAHAQAMRDNEREGAGGDALAIIARGDAPAGGAARHRPPAANDGAEAPTEFEVVCGPEGKKFKAYLCRLGDTTGPPVPSGELVSIPMDFAHDDDVQLAFRNLVEAIGIVLARDVLADEEDKPPPHFPMQ